MHKSTFAVYFGNRGFFPATLIAEARREVTATLHALGHQTLLLDAQATRHGAVETAREGAIYADFLRQHRGEFAGVILCLPNFGDENGAVAALQEADVPILLLAYPDELSRMAPELRRDAFCGKFSIMDIFTQYRIHFTALKPHTVSPGSTQFAENIAYFDRVCRVVQGMRALTIGAIGARTTPFKTVRVDEVALQRHGITVETIDMAHVIGRVNAMATSDPIVREKADVLREYTNWGDTPPHAFDNLTKLGVVLDQLIEEFGMQALAIRCWMELEEQLGVSPCVLLSELNERGIAAACEVDIANAVTMFALRQASDSPAMVLDWNNNYGDEEEKCIVFHCGPVPQSLMTDKGIITDHAILKNSLPTGCSFGCNTGRIIATDVTFAGLLTDSGALKCYLGEGRMTADPIPADYFGCAGVLEVANLQDALLTIGYQGHRHHVSMTAGHVLAPVQEALTRYLGVEVTRV